MASPLLHLPSMATNFKHCHGFRVHQFKSSLSIRKGLTRLSSGGDLIIEEDDVLFTFLKERELNGDLIARVCDKLWMRNEIKIDNVEPDIGNDSTQFQEPNVDENTGGFLKLTTTNEWLLGENTAPVNKKMQAKELRDDRKRRTRMNLLQYEAV